MPVSPLDCCLANRLAKPRRPVGRLLDEKAAVSVPHPLDWHVVMQP